MKRVIITLIISAVPMSVFAINTLQELLIVGLGFFNQLIRVAFGAAVVFFFWGLAKFLLNSGDEEARRRGRALMGWGILALFIMASIWGIVAFLRIDIIGWSF